MQILLSLLSSLVCGYGFILDELSSTRLPPFSGSITDSQYKELLSLLTTETQSRLQLDILVEQLQHNFSVTKQDLAIFDQDLNQINATLNKQLKGIANITEGLENKYSYLKRNYDSVNGTYNHLLQDNAVLENKENILKQDIQSLEQKIMTDVKHILNIQDQTRISEYQMILDQNRIDPLSKSLNFTKNCRKVENELDTRTRELEMNENSTLYMLQKNLSINTSIVAVKTCLKSYSVTSTGSIPFTDIKLSIGVNNVTSIKSLGVFTCEKPGFYLIAVFVLTSTHSNRIKIMKNNAVIAAWSFSITEHYTTGATTVIAQLDGGDKISVSSENEIHLFGGYQSCLDVLQFL